MAGHPNYTEPNAALIERCKSGDRKAFHQVYELYAKAMFNVSLRIVNNREEAEEVLQDSFLKAFDKIVSYNSSYAFGAWLKRIVINSSLDALRKRKVVFVPLDGKEYAENDNNEDPVNFDIDAIKKCMAELPDGYRTIITLFVFEDLSHKEIAEMTGISEGTSKSQYFKAKKKLFELVKQNTISNER